MEQMIGTGVGDGRESYPPGLEHLAELRCAAKRALTEWDFDVFRFHFLLGAEWKLCTRRLGITKREFFLAVDRIETQLGFRGLPRA